MSKGHRSQLKHASTGHVWDDLTHEVKGNLHDGKLANSTFKKWSTSASLVMGRIETRGAGHSLASMVFLPKIQNLNGNHKEKHPTKKLVCNLQVSSSRKPRSPSCGGAGGKAACMMLKPDRSPGFVPGSKWTRKSYKYTHDPGGLQGCSEDPGVKRLGWRSLGPAHLPLLS